MEEVEAGSDKILKEVFWQNKLEANSETSNFIRSQKQKSQEWGSRRELRSMTLQEELEAEAKNILLLPHPWSVPYWLL